ncbi:hypothetical protein BAS09_01570 [Elizabethkingia ursingii]|nr:hypothetical protein BAS09_01570 [Elizabethkingia ursingii]
MQDIYMIQIKSSLGEFTIQFSSKEKTRETLKRIKEILQTKADEKNFAFTDNGKLIIIPYDVLRCSIIQCSDQYSDIFKND